MVKSSQWSKEKFPPAQQWEVYKFRTSPKETEGTEIMKNLNPKLSLREYQKEAFQYFTNYWQEKFEGKPDKHQILFQMATGSGKTLIMVGLILYFCQQGYRNFLFFVNSTNIIDKTRDCFLNDASISIFLINLFLSRIKKSVSKKSIIYH